MSGEKRTPNFALKQQQELTRLGLTEKDRGIHEAAGYFCTECWATEDDLNSYGYCKSCADGEAVPVWWAQA